MTARFRVIFASTDDAERDADLILLEDLEHTLESIQAFCRRYGVAAEVLRGNELVGIVSAEGVFRAFVEEPEKPS